MEIKCVKTNLCLKKTPTISIINLICSENINRKQKYRFIT